jgi:hypothetical protein
MQFILSILALATITFAAPNPVPDETTFQGNYCDIPAQYSCNGDADQWFVCTTSNAWEVSKKNFLSQYELNLF